MKSRVCLGILLGLALIGKDGLNAAQKLEEISGDKGILTVIDGAGKDIKLKNWLFINGTRFFDLSGKSKTGNALRQNTKMSRGRNLPATSIFSDEGMARFT